MPTKERSRRLRLLKHQGGKFSSPEPRDAPLNPDTPVELTDAIAVNEWHRLHETLRPGHALEIERSIWIAVCTCWSQYQCLQAAASAAPVLVEGAHGGQIVNPLRVAANSACLQYLKIANLCGLSPASRSRVVRMWPTDDPHDTFSRFQRRTPKKGA